MEIKPFRADHLRRLMLEPSNQYMRPMIDPGQAEVLEITSTAFAGIESGRVVGCGGIMPVWPGRAIAWSVLAADSGPCMVHIHKVTCRLLDLRPERRIEATCDATFSAAHRWLRMLGFRLEAARMDAFTPDGAAHSLYARVH